MARKKQNPDDERHAMLQDSEAIGNQLMLTSAMSIAERSRLIFSAADKLMTEICLAADSIKIDGFKQFEEGFADSVLVTKPFFFDVVDIRRKAIYGELDTDKLQEQANKTDEGTEWTAKHNEMRKLLLAQLVKTDGEFTTILTTSAEADTNVHSDEADFIEWPEDIKKLIDECAKTRQHINKVLWPSMDKYANAFAIWCEADKWEFHDLLKWWHYRQGGYPKEGSKPKAWELIDKFQYMLRQSRKYGFDFIDGYLDRFGLDIDVIKEKPDDNAYIWDL